MTFITSACQRIEPPDCYVLSKKITSKEGASQGGAEAERDPAIV